MHSITKIINVTFMIIKVNLIIKLDIDLCHIAQPYFVCTESEFSVLETLVNCFGSASFVPGLTTDGHQTFPLTPTASLY